MSNGNDFGWAQPSMWGDGGSIAPTNFTTPPTPIGDGTTTVDPGTYPAGGPYPVTSAGQIQPQAGGGGTLGNIGNWISNNPMSALGIAAGGGMLLSEAFGTNPEQANMNLLQQSATGAGTMATALQAPLFSGVLPPGAQSALNTAKQNQIAQVRSSYARAGMAGSTGEADAINAVNANIAAQQYGIAMNMFSQAAGYAKLQSADLMGLLDEQRAQDQDFSNALSRFVSALSGGGTATPGAGGGGGGGGGAAANAGQTTSQTASPIGSLFSSIFNSL
jgi:hypothetical protein